MSTGARNSSRSVFTAIQWQELEHQALIFKYMVSGVPVPPQLLYSLHPPNHLQQQQQQQSIGWGCYQVGFGRKADPEPGRCRRTDGKKWRCSKEAHPDSKYCEKHMHRGRNRSRKPVELASPITNSSSSSAAAAASLTLNTDNHLLSFPASTSAPMSLMPSSSASSSSSSSTTSTSTSTAQPINYTHQQNYQPCHPNPFMFLDSPRTGINQDYSLNLDHLGVNKRGLFGEEASCMETIADGNGGSYDQRFGNMYTKQGQAVQEQCFVLGADIKSYRAPMRSENDHHETPKPAVHHQFLEDWDSPENQLHHSTNWLDLASNARANK